MVSNFVALLENLNFNEIVLQITEQKNMYFIKLEQIKIRLLCYTNSQNWKIIESNNFIDKKSITKIVCQIAALANSSKHCPICYTNVQN